MYGWQRRKELHLDCQLSSRHTSRKNIPVFCFLIFKWWHYLYGIILPKAFWDCNVLYSQEIENYISEMIYQMQHKLGLCSRVQYSIGSCDMSLPCMLARGLLSLKVTFSGVFCVCLFLTMLIDVSRDHDSTKLLIMNVHNLMSPLNWRILN